MEEESRKWNGKKKANALTATILAVLSVTPVLQLSR
jgi:hypothetical protein